MPLFQITAQNSKKGRVIEGPVLRPPWLPRARQGANDVALAGRWPWSLHGSHVASEPCVEPTNEAQVPWEKSKPRADGSFLGEGVGRDGGTQNYQMEAF